MIAFETRASAVLFNLIRSHPAEGPFLLPANICPIVPMVFFKAKRQIEFIDIAPNTFCIDHDALVDRWMKPNNKPAGIIYARTYCAIFDAADVFGRIKSLSPHALIVDDRCLCPPEFTGTLAPNTDVALYSTGHAKYVDVGFGGYGLVGDHVPYSRTEMTHSAGDLDAMIANYKNVLKKQEPFSYTDSAWLDTTYPKTTWTEYRAIIEHELIRIAAAKTLINSIYSDRLPAEIQFPKAFQSWRFNIQVRDKAAVLAAIHREGLFASGHYDSLAGLFGPGSAPFTQKVHQHVVNLFNDRYFSSEQATKLTDLLVHIQPPNPGPLFS